MLKQCIVLSCLLCFIQAHLIAVCPTEIGCDNQLGNTTDFECSLEENNCPYGYVCCKNSPYLHPVCLKPTYIEKRCPLVSFITPKMQECESDEECPSDEMCCQDGSYPYNICLLPRPIQKESDNCKSIVQQNKCTIPFAYSITKNIECTSDNECDHKSICCSDNCFEHRICKQFIPPSKENLMKCKLLDNTCKNGRKNLNETTQDLECTTDENCEAGSICCYDSCYKHRICKKVKESLKEVEISNNTSQCPQSNSNKNSCLHPNAVARYACKEDSDCFIDDICCEDKCYDHKICKRPNVNSLIAKPNNIKHNGISECLVVYEKCELPYLLRLAYPFKCNLEEDCSKGYSCCRQSCNNYFKVCTKNSIEVKDDDHADFNPETSGQQGGDIELSSGSGDDLNTNKKCDEYEYDCIDGSDDYYKDLLD